MLSRCFSVSMHISAAEEMLFYFVQVNIHVCMYSINNICSVKICRKGVFIEVAGCNILIICFLQSGGDDFKREQENVL